MSESVSIELVLPNNGEESVTFFRSLRKLLEGTASQCSENEILLTPVDLVPKIVFRLSGKNHQTTIAINADNNSTCLPETFTVSKTKTKQRISLVEAVKRLQGIISAVDHVGVVVPSDVTNDDWGCTINLLAAKTPLFDYPTSEEYDSSTSRWLFVVPFTGGEQSSGSTIGERRRQPKFELVYDASVKNSIIQIDMETTLTRSDIFKLFPKDESFDLPGLGEFFRNVNVTTPWEGAEVFRLDLRYKDEGLNPWNTGTFLIKNGKRVQSGSYATKLPSFVQKK